jgi:hypothetical protein
MRRPVSAGGHLVGHGEDDLILFFVRLGPIPADWWSL